mgnify:CR=1 FL=1
MEKFSTFEEKIRDELGPGDLVRIKHRNGAAVAGMAYGFVLGIAYEKKQSAMFPIIKVYDINQGLEVELYSHNLEIISSKQ